MNFKRNRDLFIEFIADCIAYITALVFVTFLLELNGKEPIYQPALYPLIIFL
jgi:hypothetical protein